MAAQLTTDQASEYLDELGISLPSFVLSALVCQVNSIDSCLDAAGYDDCAVTLIKTYAFGLMAICNGARRIKSQAAGDVSRSFDYGTGSQYKQIYEALANIDTSRCADTIIPADPDKTNSGLWIAGDGAYL